MDSEVCAALSRLIVMHGYAWLAQVRNEQVVAVCCLSLMIAGSIKPRPNPASSWLPERSWRQLVHLSTLPTFAGLDDAVAADPAAWQAVYDDVEPHRGKLPGLYNMLGDFRRLLVIRYEYVWVC